MPRSGVGSSSEVGRFVPREPGQVTPALETFLRRWNPGFPGSSSPLGRCGCGDVRLPPGLQPRAQDDLGLGPDTFYPFFRHAELCPSPQGRGEKFSLSLGHAALLRSLLLMALGQPPLSSADRAAWAPCPPDSPGRVGVCGLIDTFFFLPIICEACVESERGGVTHPTSEVSPLHVRAEMKRSHGVCRASLLTEPLVWGGRGPSGIGHFPDCPASLRSCSWPRDPVLGSGMSVDVGFQEGSSSPVRAQLSLASAFPSFLP